MVGSAAAAKRDDKFGDPQVGAPDARAVPPRVRELVGKAKYESPKVVAFPLDGMNASVITLSANM